MEKALSAISASICAFDCAAERTALSLKYMISWTLRKNAGFQL
jgi:hypothetical protein